MELKDYRIALHRAAETGQYLPKTQKIITACLEKLSCSLEFPWESAVAAYFDFGFDGTIALRADMDALPVSEKTGLEYCSDDKNTMHACGHDGHMAMLLDIAERLDCRDINPSQNVLLIFQPAEETTGGAKPILDTGIFEKYRVKAVFGMHLIPDLPKSQLFTRNGAMMAKSCEITVSITGASVHIAKYKEGADTLAAAAFYLTNIYRLTDELKEINYKLLRFGKARSGSVRNAVSAFSCLEGSLRCFDENDYDVLYGIALETARLTDQIYKTNTTVTVNEGYPPLINDGALVSRLSEILPLKQLPEPRMITDDFSWYLKKVPGAYIFLGTGTGIELHSDKFDYDISVLETGVAAYKKIIENL